VAEQGETARAVRPDLEDDQLTQAVLASFEQAGGERFRTVMRSLVRHLHAFVWEVELTEEEWARGIDFPQDQYAPTSAGRWSAGSGGPPSRRTWPPPA
jgi:hypothetical protein